MARDDVCHRIDRLRDRIDREPEQGRVDTRVRAMPANEVLDDALRALTTYHTHAVLEASGDRILVGAMKLLYYYQNRTAHIAPTERSPPDHETGSRGMTPWASPEAAS